MRKLLQRLITSLYKRFCSVEVGTLYLDGIQRNFSKKLNETECKLRDNQSKNFVDNHVCEWIFNEVLKEYVEALFKYGETEPVRNALHNNINVVLKVEQKIKQYALSQTTQKEFDKFEPL